MCKWGDTVTLTAPSLLYVPNRRSVSVIVDRCLSDAVRALWWFGYSTYGSCCGHGRIGGQVCVGALDTKKDGDA